MSEIQADFRRVLSSTGLYAAAALAQQGVSFLLLPIYTRFVEPARYGELELLNAFSSIAFACLTMGMASAVTKCYHRDCAGPADQATVLPTAVALDLPVLLLGSGLIFALARPLSAWLLGTPAEGGLVRLIAATGLLSSVTAVILASLRAQERALAFGVLTLAQFAGAMVLNILLVVHYRMGVHGILWGNFLANAAAVPLAAAVARRGSELRFNRRLAAPLTRFGILLLPVLLSAWVMDLSDRYVLRLFAGLGPVAVYAVGYKLGMVLQLAIVWPFQLAWPAVSFSISHRAGHQETYSRTLTYLCAALGFGIVVLSLGSRVLTQFVVGPAYREAWRVVPLVALAYAFNGIHYCLSPGVHIAGRTRWFPLLALASAALNLGLNFLLIPRLGMMGAAWATAAAFLFLALGTAALGQRYYPIDYEYGRLAKAAAAAAIVLFVGTRVAPDLSPFSVAWHMTIALAGFPALLLATGFLTDRERYALKSLFRRRLPTPAP